MTTHDSRRPEQPHPPTAADRPGEPLAGSFTWDIATNQWTWSDEVYRIHGFEPGDITPSTDLLLSHTHPDDRDQCARILLDAAQAGTRFSHYHRIRDADSKDRHVLTVGSAFIDADGQVAELHGFLVDLTDARRDDAEDLVQQALDGALEHRGPIEMTKGAIMLAYDVTPDEAFAVLQALSASHNVKLHEIAHRFVEALSEQDPTTDAADRVDTLLREVVDPGWQAPHHESSTDQ